MKKKLRTEEKIRRKSTTSESGPKQPRGCLSRQQVLRVTSIKEGKARRKSTWRISATRRGVGEGEGSVEGKKKARRGKRRKKEVSARLVHPRGASKTAQQHLMMLTEMAGSPLPAHWSH